MAPDVNSLNDWKSIETQPSSIYNIIWTKNSNSQSCPTIAIPDTVIYHSQTIQQWYFTDKAGQIKRKRSRNFTPEKIFAEFSKPWRGRSIHRQVDEPLSDIVASHIYLEYSQSDGYLLLIKHLTLEDLKTFIFSPVKNEYSILQKFLHPTIDHNVVIEVSWTPNYTLVVRKTNIHALSDMKNPIQKKVSTFEGFDHWVDTCILTDPAINQRFKKMSKNIIDHILQISNQTVIQSILYYKIARDGIPYLIWGGIFQLLKTSSESKSCFNPTLAFPKSISNWDNKKIDINLSPGITTRQFKCPKCFNMIPCTNDVFLITNKCLFDFNNSNQTIDKNRKILDGLQLVYESNSEENRSKIDSTELIKGQNIEKGNSEESLSCFPDIVKKQPTGIKNDPIIMYNTVRVCETCCNIIRKFTLKKIEQVDRITQGYESEWQRFRKLACSPNACSQTSTLRNEVKKLKPKRPSSTTSKASDTLHRRRPQSAYQ